MNNLEAKIKELEELGYDRRDIQVLPDGSLTIVQHDEFRGAAETIAKAIARQTHTHKRKQSEQSAGQSD